MNVELLVSILGLPPGPMREYFHWLLTTADRDVLAATYDLELALMRQPQDEARNSPQEAP